jgi:N-acyl-D-aspartate/D-glutamate deacylase
VGHPHPRNYGAFARVLGYYVRDEKVLPLEEAIRKMTTLFAWRIRQLDRGVLRDGAFGDVVVFDPATIRDNSTFEQPHQFASGVKHVLVNGVPVLVDGAFTGERPGRVLTLARPRA